MKKIVFFSIPLFGHVNYGLKIAKRLSENGHEVVYYSGIAYRRFIENSGVCFHPYSAEIEYLFSFKDSTYNNEYMQNVRAENLDHVVEWYKFCHHLYTITNIFMKTDIRELDQPDLVIYDSAALWGRYVSNYFSVKSIASCTPYTYPEQFGTKDLHRFSRLIFRKNLNAQEVNRLIHIINYKLNNKFPDVAPCSVFEPLSPHSDFKLIYTVKEFQAGCEYLDLKTTFFCGVIQEDQAVQSDFSELLAYDVPNVYIAFGSIYNNASVFRQLYESCKHLDFNFILNIGTTIELDSFRHLPDNWKVIRSVNQFELLKHIDIFVSHGGVNSIREAMQCGVPVIVLPTEGDTFCTAEDIKEKNLGMVLDIKDITMIGSVVEELSQNKAIKENCMKLSDVMRQSAGLNGAVDVITNILGGN